MDEHNINKYTEYFQYCDPITRKLAQRRSATLVDEVMPQTQLLKSEFFNDFLFVDGLYYGINLHLYQNTKNIGDLRIWRSCRRNEFDESSRTILDLLKPHLIQVISNIRRINKEKGTLLPYTTEEKSIFLKYQFRFTDRETHVVRLLLNGESDSNIADLLNVHVTTVRTHVKHIFRKAGVHNRSKLHAAISQLSENTVLSH